jgi:hypothetical protein
MTRMTPKELVGRRIKQARSEMPVILAGGQEVPLDQEGLGKMLEPQLGKAWTKQAVSAAETGRRVIDITELMAFSSVLAKPIPWFFLPFGPDDELEMPSGITSDVKSLSKVLSGSSEDVIVTATQGLTIQLETIRALLEGMNS